MDVNALDIFWVAITFIKVVLFIANVQTRTTNSASDNDNTKRPVCSNPTNFDIMRETK